MNIVGKQDATQQLVTVERVCIRTSVLETIAMKIKVFEKYADKLFIIKEGVHTMEENKTKVKKDSAIGIVFQAIGILIWIFGGIGSVIGVIIALSDRYGVWAALLAAVGVALSGMFFYGFGEALSLLKEIYAMLKNQNQEQ